jgi:hypothetical protein
VALTPTAAAAAPPAAKPVIKLELEEELYELFVV